MPVCNIQMSRQRRRAIRSCSRPTVGEEHEQWMVAQTPTTLAIIYSHQSALKHVDSCCILSADDRCETRLRTTFRVSGSQLINVETLNSSTFFVADMVIPFGRHDLFVWPMWSWPIWLVADMVCGRYGTDPKSIGKSKIRPPVKS